MGEKVDQLGVNVNGVLSENWAIMEDDEDYEEGSTSSESLLESSEESGSSSASDMAEDASSSTSNSLSSSSSSGPLYELSELMLHLPIKRGLSKYYQGKSQSFTSLANAKSMDDLAKREVSLSPTRKKMKSCKSYGGGLTSNGKKEYSPKSAIARKGSRGSSFFFQANKRSCFVGLN